MTLYIYLALILYAASIGLVLVDQIVASVAFSIASTVLVGVVLLQAYREVERLKERFWDKLANIWLGGEYASVIWLFIFAGVGTDLLSVFLWHQAASTFPTAVGAPMISPEEAGKFLGLGALALGVLALALVWFVAWAYLIEVFTRDLYLIRVVSGVGGFKPHSATFYIIISLITVWFLYFYWLYSVWRWISQLKTSTGLPHSTSTTPTHPAPPPPPPVFASVAFLVLPDGSRVELKGDAVLGRSWVASIFPNAPWLNRISEAHAVIRRKTDGWYIEDLGSQYGTYVNGRDIRGAGEVKLNPGDVISLGGVFTLVFQT
jgi:hypothetical protein